MNLGAVDSIANAVLYEGYILYPYRSSAVKNQRRWNFGVVYPRAYAEAQTGADLWQMQTECLVQGTAQSSVEIRVRFLRLVERLAGRLQPEFQPLPSVEVGGRIYESWEEAAEHSVCCEPQTLGGLLLQPHSEEFSLPFDEQMQELPGAALLRRSQAVRGTLKISAAAFAEGVFRLTVTLSNNTDLPPGEETREQALARSMISAHTALGVRNGEFASLLDPPDHLSEAAADCHNIGTWPVLVGNEKSRDTMLSSPIILYDYPQIAPESAGDLFDGTEIDEILTLRILTLTDDEKAAMRSSDDRASRLLDRAEALPPEHFMKLHGVLREVALDRSGGLT